MIRKTLHEVYSYHHEKINQEFRDIPNIKLDQWVLCLDKNNNPFKFMLGPTDDIYKLHVVDVCIGLNKIYRYKNQAHIPITVAQHTYFGMSMIDDLDDKLAFAFHDFEEFIIGDVIKPFELMLDIDFEPIKRAVRRRLKNACLYSWFSVNPSLNLDLYDYLMSLENNYIVNNIDKKCFEYELQFLLVPKTEQVNDFKNILSDLKINNYQDSNVAKLHKSLRVGGMALNEVIMNCLIEKSEDPICL